MRSIKSSNAFKIQFKISLTDIGRFLLNLSQGCKQFSNIKCTAYTLHIPMLNDFVHRVSKKKLFLKMCTPGDCDSKTLKNVAKFLFY